MTKKSELSVDEYKDFMKAVSPKKRSGTKKNKVEERLQLRVCNYLKQNYPDVIFFCDVASGLHLPIWIGALHSKMRSSKGLPDLFIAKRKWEDFSMIPTIEYSGLFIEIKKEGLRLKNGGLPKDKHISEQCVIIQRLKEKGYKAEFGVGFEECKKLIDDYLK